MGSGGADDRPDARTARRRAGDSAEDAVAGHLAAAGWAILARNVRIGRSEVDIVAIEPGHGGALVVVEVRSRTSAGFGEPEESVDAAKVGRLYRIASELLRAGRLPDGRLLPGDIAASGAFRVDLVAVVRAGPLAAWTIRRHLRGLLPP